MICHALDWSVDLVAHLVHWIIWHLCKLLVIQAFALLIVLAYKMVWRRVVAPAPEESHWNPGRKAPNAMPEPLPEVGSDNK